LLVLLTRIPTPEILFESFNDADVSSDSARVLKGIAILSPSHFHLIVDAAIQMVNHQDWNVRAGGLLAFQSAIKGGSTGEARIFYCNHFKLILDKTCDESIYVRNSTFLVLCSTIQEFPDLTKELSFMREMFTKIENCQGLNPVLQTRSFELLRVFLKTSQEHGKSGVIDVEYQNLVSYLQKSLDQTIGDESPAFFWAGESLSLLLRSTPEQFQGELEGKFQGLFGILKNILDRIDLLGRSLTYAIDKSLIERNISVFCSLIYGIAMSLKNKLRPCIPATMTILIRCLDLQSPSLYEEAMLTTSTVVACCNHEDSHFIPVLVKHIVLAQVSRSPSIISFGALLVAKMAETFREKLQDHTKTILDSLSVNLKDDMLPMLTIKSIIVAIRAMIEFGGITVMPFCEFYLRQLNKFVNLPDDETDGNLYATLASGYRSVIMTIHDHPLFKQVNFKIILGPKGLMDKIAKLENLDKILVESVIALLRKILEIYPHGGPVKAYLHSNCINVILEKGISVVPDCRRLRKDLEKV